jgi:hypothetical protein
VKLGRVLGSVESGTGVGFVEDHLEKRACPQLQDGTAAQRRDLAVHHRAEHGWTGSDPFVSGPTFARRLASVAATQAASGSIFKGSLGPLSH